jgi:hypothetical protein
MIPMEPGPEDFSRQLAERRAEMERSRAIVRYAHSRTGLLTRFVQRLADRVDPTGRARRELL